MKGLDIETILTLETQARVPLYQALSDARLANARLGQEIAALKALNATQAGLLQKLEAACNEPQKVVAVIRGEDLQAEVNNHLEMQESGTVIHVDEPTQQPDTNAE